MMRKPQTKELVIKTSKAQPVRLRRVATSKNFIRKFARLFAAVICLTFSLSFLTSHSVLAFDLGNYQTRSSSVLVYNLDTDKVLYSENADEKRAIASLTKIMTVYLAATSDKPLDTLVTISSDMVRVNSEFYVGGLRPGDTLTLEDLLYYTLLPSAADAAQALAITVSGSIPDFVEQMNEKAKEWGMENTHFSNVLGYDFIKQPGSGAPVSNALGLDTDPSLLLENGVDNYSTAEDVLKMLKNALKNDTFKKIFETKEYEIKSLNEIVKSTVSSTAKTYGLPADVIKGSKTGFTNLAGRSLASVAEVTANLLVINLGAPTDATSHIEDAVAIFDYYNQNYAYRQVAEAGTVLKVLPVVGGNFEEIEIREDTDYTEYLKNSDLDIVVEFIPDQIFDGSSEINSKMAGGEWYKFFVVLAPGTKLGEVNYNLAETTLLSHSVYLETELIFINWPLIIACVFLIVLLITLIVFRIIRKNTKNK